MFSVSWPLDKQLTMIPVCVAMAILNLKTRSKLVSIALAYSATARVMLINIGFCG